MARQGRYSFKNIPSFCAPRFSASAAARSGSDASNSTSSWPASSPSIHAVHFSSNVFIEVPQEVLQFFSGVEKPGHHCADRAAQRFRNLVVLHVFGFLHQNYRAMLRRELLDGRVDPGPDFLAFHPLMGKRVGFRRCPRGGIDFLQLDGVVELGAAAFDLLLPEPIDGDVGHDPVNPGVERGLAAEAPDRFPGLEEAVLGKVPGVLLAMYHVVNHAKNSCPVASDQLVKRLGIPILATFYQFEFRDIGLSRSRFRMHIWTESPPIKSTAPRGCRSGEATHPGIAPSER